MTNEKNMRIYCLGRKKHTDNVMIMSKKLVMIINKKIKGKSRCADCMAIKSFYDKIKYRSELEIIVSRFLID